LLRKGKLFVLPALLAGMLFLTPYLLHGSTPSIPPQATHLNNQDPSALKKIRAPFRFVVIGDNRTGTAVYGQLVDAIVKESPAFVVSTGDVISDGKNLEEWNEFVRISSPLTMPYFLTPGNHEISGKAAEAMYKGLVDQPGNKLYYSFEVGDALFIVLDSEEPGKEAKVTGEQYKWLEEQLKGSRDKFKFVFVHRPLYPAKMLHFTACLSRHKDCRDSLECLLEKYKVDVLFAGHEHLYKRQYVCGVTHIITGGGGAPLYASEKEGGFNHYIAITVNDGSASFRVTDIDNRTRDEFSILKDKKP
jgi:predicted phosphodiesterase